MVGGQRSQVPRPNRGPNEPGKEAKCRQIEEKNYVDLNKGYIFFLLFLRDEVMIRGKVEVFFN